MAFHCRWLTEVSGKMRALARTRFLALMTGRFSIAFSIGTPPNSSSAQVSMSSPSQGDQAAGQSVQAAAPPPRQPRDDGANRQAAGGSRSTPGAPECPSQHSGRGPTFRRHEPSLSPPNRSRVDPGQKGFADLRYKTVTDRGHRLGALTGVNGKPRNSVACRAEPCRFRRGTGPCGGRETAGSARTEDKDDAGNRTDARMIARMIVQSAETAPEIYRHQGQVNHRTGANADHDGLAKSCRRHPLGHENRRPVQGRVEPPAMLTR